jgi:hypothetical protein
MGTVVAVAETDGDAAVSCCRPQDLARVAPSCYTAVVALADVLLMGALSPKRWRCASAEPTLLMEWLQLRLPHHHCCRADVVAGWPLLLHTR